MSHRALYVTSIVVLVGMTLVALLSFRPAKESAEATQKAQQLQAELDATGMRVPTTEQIVNVLGTDGGASCLDPDDALRRSTLYGMLTNGAAGPGQRPVIVDDKAVQGQLLIVKVYCPENLDAFQQMVDELEYAEVAG